MQQYMDGIQKGNNKFIKNEMDAINIQLEEISKQVNKMTEDINEVFE